MEIGLIAVIIMVVISTISTLVDAEKPREPISIKVAVISAFVNVLVIWLLVAVIGVL